MRSLMLSVAILVFAIGCTSAPRAQVDGAMQCSSGGVPMDAPNRATVENRYEFPVVIEWSDATGDNQKLLAGRGAQMSLLFVGFEEVGGMRAYKADDAGKPTKVKLLVVPKRDGVSGIFGGGREYVVR